MKLFHISDLHLGKRVYEFSMMEEQDYILRQILEQAEQEQPDVLLITGDIYDKPVPPVEAVRLLDSFLTALSEKGIPTYIIAGNHDSAQRLEFGRDLMAQSGIFFCGAPKKKIVSFSEKDEYGEVHFYLLPFFKAAHINGLFGEKTAESDGEGVELLLKETEIDYTKRNVLLAHQFVTWKGTAERSDSETLSLGGVDEMDASLFFDFDYVALGHLHGPQRMGKDTIRYAGSPLPYSFSEIRQRKGITVVELKKKGDCSVKQIPLIPRRAFREIRGIPLAELLAAAKKEAPTEDYIRCILTDQEALLDPVGQLRQVYPNLMALEFEEREDVFQRELSFQAEEIRPQELFARFFEKQNNKELSDEQVEVLEKIWRGLEGNQE